MKALARSVMIIAAYAVIALQTPSASADIIGEAEAAWFNGEDELARKLYGQACDQNLAAACVKLAQMLRAGQGGPEDTAAAREILDKALRLARSGCDAGNAKDCSTLGVELYDKSGSASAAEGLIALQKAEALDQRACETGDAEACLRHGKLLASPPRGYRNRDPAAARTSLTRACDENIVAGCFELGQLLTFPPFGSDADDTEALNAYVKACDGGHSFSCQRASQMYRVGEGAPADPAQARVFEERACDVGTGYEGARTCAGLGQTYMRSSDAGPADLVKARTAMEKACLRSTRYCWYLAEMLANGQGGPQDDALAREKLELACQGDGQSPAYGLLAELLRAGRGGPQDQVRARQLFEKSCEGTYPKGCLGAAEMYWLGEGGPQDDAKAKALLRRACKQAVRPEEKSTLCRAELPTR